MSPDNKILASGHGDRTIKLWSLEKRELICTLGDRFSKHLGKILSVDISPDGKTLISSSSDRNTKIWDTITGKEIHTFLGDTVAINYNDQVFSSSLGKHLRIKNISDGKIIYSILGDSEVLLQAFSPDARIIATTDCSGVIKLWNVKSGQEIYTLTGHLDRVSGIVFNSDRKTLITGSWDKTIKLWNLQTGELLETLEGHSGKVLSLAISSDNKIIISGSSDYSIKIWQHK